MKRATRTFVCVAVCALAAFAKAQQYVPSSPEQDEVAAFGKRVESADDINGIQAVVLFTFAMRYLSSHRHEDAIRTCSILLKKYSEWGNKDATLGVKNCLLQASIGLGRFDDAEMYINALLRDSQATDSDGLISRVGHLWTLGTLYRARGYLALSDATQATAQSIVESKILPTITSDRLISPATRAEARRSDDLKHEEANAAFQASSLEYQRLDKLRSDGDASEKLSQNIKNALADMTRFSGEMSKLEIDKIPRMRIERVLTFYLAILRQRWELARALGRDNEASRLLEQIVARTPQYTGDLPTTPESLAMHRLMTGRGQQKEAREYLEMARWAALAGVGYAGTTTGILPRVFNNDGAESLFGSPSRSGLVSASIAQLGRVYLAEGNFDQAKRFLLAALEGAKYAAGEGSDDFVLLLVDLASIDRSLGNDAAALDRLRFALKMVTSKSEDEILLPAGRAVELANARERVAFGLIELIARLPESSVPVDREALLFGAFHLLRRSAAEASITAASIRKAQSDPTLAREVEAYQVAAKELAGLRGAYARLDSAASGSVSSRLVESIEEKKAAAASMRTRIASAMPRGNLAFGEGTDFATVSKSLGEGEAIMQFAFNDERGFVLLTKKDAQTVHPVTLSRAELMADVKGLLKATGFEVNGTSISTRPYPLAIAHAVYGSIFRGLEGPLNGVKRLFVVADGPLEGLPFGALLRSPASLSTKVNEYDKLDWLIRTYELAYLPSAAILPALRRGGSTSAKKLMLGVGNPITTANGAKAPTRGSYVDHGGNVAAPTNIPPSSIAGGELEAIRNIIGEKEATLYSGPRATKAVLFKTSLENYQVIVFATHGYLASSMSQVGEPALLMSSPPNTKEPSYLLASEVASLRLDANLVVLNACDTAGPDGLPGAEALSGLASAFFFAGARSVIVSLWPIYDAAAKSTSVEFIRAATAKRSMTSAEALKSASVKLLTGDRRFRHPAFWAPYLLVGDGAVSPFLMR